MAGKSKRNTRTSKTDHVLSLLGGVPAGANREQAPSAAPQAGRPGEQGGTSATEPSPAAEQEVAMPVSRPAPGESERLIAPILQVEKNNSEALSRTIRDALEQTLVEETAARSETQRAAGARPGEADSFAEEPPAETDPAESVPADGKKEAGSLPGGEDARAETAPSAKTRSEEPSRKEPAAPGEKASDEAQEPTAPENEAPAEAQEPPAPVPEAGEGGASQMQTAATPPTEEQGTEAAPAPGGSTPGEPSAEAAAANEPAPEEKAAAEAQESQAPEEKEPEEAQNSPAPAEKAAAEAQEPPAPETPFAPRETRLPDGAVCLNVMELLVDERLERYVRMFGLCTCPRCLADARALALSRLPAKYVVLSAAAATPMTSLYRAKYESMVVAQVIQACKAVMESPRHTL